MRRTVAALNTPRTVSLTTKVGQLSGQDTVDTPDSDNRALFLPQTFYYKTKGSYGQSAIPLFDDKRSVMTVHDLDASGAIIPTPVAKYDEFIVQSIIESTRERSQLITTSSGLNKAYFFGREHQLFNVSAKLLDTRLNNSINGWNGKGLANWKIFYDTHARLSECARLRRIVKLTYTDRVLYGAVLQNNRTHSSLEPHTYDLSFLLYVVLAESANG